jgi:hypothetical protein
MRDSAVDSSDTMLWRWTRGIASLNQFGDPGQSTDYALCIYDHSGGAAALVQSAIVPAGGVCAGVNCWKRLSRGFRYKNTFAEGNGVRMLLLKEGVDDNAKFLVKGKGVDLALPSPFSVEKILAQDPSVTVQLVNSAGFCWGTVFDAPANSNRPNYFKDEVEP